MTTVQLDLVDLVNALPVPERVYLRRVDPSRNMSRFYAIAIERTLFGEFALVREWGRIGRGGQTKSTVFPSGREAESSFNRLRREKERRGYWLSSSSSATMKPASNIARERSTRVTGASLSPLSR